MMDARDLQMKARQFSIVFFSLALFACGHSMESSKPAAVQKQEHKIVPAAAKPPASKIKIDSALFGAIEARAIGPAVMGGRIMDIEARPDDPKEFYVGTASGGLWRTKNGGANFEPIFDKHNQSIGALALDPKNPKVIWVGTGEGALRNSVTVGDGLYKTTDGGDNWQRVGLLDSERISRIVINPKNTDEVFVAVLGHLWDANEERGVYRTADGGKTWKRILYVDENTGCADLKMDPQNPRLLYAAMWQFRRSPDFFESGGPGSGLYKSVDGGKTWRKIQRGLPAGNLGRIGLAIAGSQPQTVYAVVEARKTALYRSDDRGENWLRLDSSFNTTMRPFYFSELVVAPDDPKRVYKLGLLVAVSEDGGESFSSPFTHGAGMGRMHPDLHAMWINPKDSDEILAGTDGGVYKSMDRGNNWFFLNNMPLAQFYHISVDNDRPYNVYGGLQDNGSWMGPSSSINGIENRDWKGVGMGDGFHVYADPTDSNVVYCEYQGGNILRHHHATHEVKDIRPYPQEGEAPYRFNWDTALHMSPTRPGSIYAGAQFLFRSSDQGETWQRLSGDLTTNDPQKQRQEDSGGLTIDNSTAENHCTIVTISESPQDGQVIWVGTDDGNLQLTQDDGKTWTNVVGNVPDLPKGTWVTGVEAGRFHPAEAFVVFDGHRTGDKAVYVYHTNDYGKTWTSLAGDQIEGYARVIRQDLVNPHLLFLGTEFGLYISVDGGQKWARLTGKMPKVAVHDIVVHPRDGDVIIGTHGRGVFILDDITPLRHVRSEILNQDVAFLPSRPSVVKVPTSQMAFPGDDDFVGRNPNSSAIITYYLKKRHVFGKLSLEIYGPDGKLIKTLPGSRRRGINRVSWTMREKAPTLPPSPQLAGMGLFGPMVPAGTYTVKLIKGKQTYKGQVELVFDPDSPYSEEDRRLQEKTVWRLYRMQEELSFLDKTATSLRDQARKLAEQAGKNSDLARGLGQYADKLDTLHATMVETKEGLLTDERKLRKKIVELYGAVNNYGGRPTGSQMIRLRVLSGELDASKKTLDAYLKQVDTFNRDLGAEKINPLKVMSLEEFRKLDTDLSILTKSQVFQLGHVPCIR
jgi:photosystem II stability/assembly factor-like uncharacterized protein